MEPANKTGSMFARTACRNSYEIRCRTVHSRLGVGGWWEGCGSGLVLSRFGALLCGWRFVRSRIIRARLILRGWLTHRSSCGLR